MGSTHSPRKGITDPADLAAALAAAEASSNGANPPVTADQTDPGLSGPDESTVMTTDAVAPRKRVGDIIDALHVAGILPPDDDGIGFIQSIYRTLNLIGLDQPLPKINRGTLVRPAIITHVDLLLAQGRTSATTPVATAASSAETPRIKQHAQFAELTPELQQLVLLADEARGRHQMVVALQGKPGDDNDELYHRESADAFQAVSDQMRAIAGMIPGITPRYLASWLRRVGVYFEAVIKSDEDLVTAVSTLRWPKARPEATAVPVSTPPSASAPAEVEPVVAEPGERAFVVTSTGEVTEPARHRVTSEARRVAASQPAVETQPVSQESADSEQELAEPTPSEFTDQQLIELVGSDEVDQLFDAIYQRYGWDSPDMDAVEAEVRSLLIARARELSVSLA